MSQVQVAPATPATAVAPAVTTSPPAAVPSPAEDTPKLLNRWLLVAVAAGVLFGLLAALWQLLAWQAAGRAADESEQLVRVQEIRSSLFRADALASTAYLVGGLESPDSRASYDAAVDRALVLVADAAEAQPADRAALGELNTAISAYADDVTQARAANREGDQVGAEYLRLAGAALAADGDLARPLDALVTANTERAEDEMDGQNTLPILLTGLLALGALWWVNRQLARRFHRRYNVGLVVAAAVVAALTVVTAGYSAWVNGRHEEIRDNSFQRAFDEAGSRSAGSQAKAAEARRLIARSSGEGADDAWAAAAAVVADSADEVTLPLWDDYAGLHEELVDLDDAGDWAAAVELATEGGAGTAIDAFDAASSDVVADAAATTADDLRASRPVGLILIVLTLLGGLAAWGAATWGIAQRRREFA
ncbi:hypothetical protein [Nocardioides sp. W7]|uniref:hypothetical protein n=1 Tax=Nocardioides sp. W7 TaxID=2931390 RepID=UPI001FD628C0|nr:hypothetical protein [Nocardioides sp. W7]